jgi:SMC interacting uncharacterized protein involved in chromosome segregation
MTIEEQLIKAASELSALTAERDELRTAIEAAASKEAKDFESTLAKNAELNTALETLGVEKNGLLAKIAELEANTVSASVEAAKIAASVGVSPVELSPSDVSVEAAAPVNHLQHFLSLPMGAERSSYFAKYKNEIVRGI